MKTNKNLSLAASILEIVASGIMFLLLIINIAKIISLNHFSVIYFSLLPVGTAVFYMVDGILSIKYAKLDDNKFIAVKSNLLTVGIIIIVLTVICSGSLYIESVFALSLVSGIFKIVASNLKPKQVVKTNDQLRANSESTFELLLKVDKLKKEGLITDEEFAAVKKQIIENQKLDK